MLEIERANGGSSRTLEKYKRRLLLQVVAIFTICLLVILERIFYQVIIENEENTLSSLQLNSDLIVLVEDSYLPKEITNGFLEFFGALSKFRYQFFLLTHLFITLYVAVDAMLTTKIAYITMGVIYLISLLQMLYGGARPFWTTNSILCSDCLSSYTHPSLGLVISIFLPYYAYYCWKKRSGDIFTGKMSTKSLVMAIGLFVIIGVIQFLNYFTGSVFIINLALSLICVLLLIMIVISINSVFDQVLKKSTVIQVDAKKYVFYWLLFICLLQTFVLIVYSGQEVFLDIDWVKNYLKCTEYHNYDTVNYRYDEVVGPWFNFLQTATLFAWIGAVFGISHCFSKMGGPEWCKGSVTKRIIRAAIANILIIPSWIFVAYIETGSWVKDIGLNEFIVDAVHYFILYIWLFGFMPVLVLDRLLKLVNKDGEDFYVILQDQK